MLASIIPILADLLQEYYESGELQDVARLFSVELPDLWPSSTSQQWLAVARHLIQQLDQGNHYALVLTLVQQIEIRSATAIGRTDWERRAAHEALRPQVTQLRSAIEKAGAPAELAVLEGSPFTAKSHVRELLATASTSILVVDPYIGVATLDCLRSVSKPVRLLTGAHPASIEPGFDSALLDFRQEGFAIEVRRAPMLHDRHLVFNDRCWLLGSSLKDAGKKAFHCMEIVDSKADVVQALNAKWSAGSAHA